MSKRTIKIYTDGACRGNGKEDSIGAWAYMLYDTKLGKLKFKCDAIPMTTNNAMELFAILKSLKAMKRYDVKVEVYTDSKYSYNILTNWMYGWAENNWMKEIKNYTTIRTLYTVVNLFDDIEFFWVKGHSDNTGNAICDKLCNLRMDNKVPTNDAKFKDMVEQFKKENGGE